MWRLIVRLFTLNCLVFAATSCALTQSAAQPHEEFLVEQGEIGRPGGHLVVPLRSEPKTLNPVTALDQPSRTVFALLNADLVHINRITQRTEPALAKSWKISHDDLHYTLTLRKGIRFSDGQPFDASDVVFTFQVYLDPKLESPQRDLLIVGGKPISVRQLGPYKVEFDFTQPYAPAERIFDSLAMLPRHLLVKAYHDGTIAQAWTLNTPPGQIAGLGPFRLKEHVPGQSITLERNPYYWKQDSADNRLPYFDEVHFLIVPSEDAEIIRFESGDLDLLNSFSAANYSVLARQQAARGYRLYDLGPGLVYNFLFFNLNDLRAGAPPQLAEEQAWFRDVRFRQAVSAAIDREAIVRLVYQGRATPLWGNVTPGNKLWLNQAIPHPPRSLDNAKALLRAAGFSWNSGGALLDSRGTPVEFSILTNSSNAERTQITTLIQNDLQQLGMNVHVVSLDFRSMLDRIFHTFNYEAAVLGLGGGDVDPTPEMNVWMSDGSTHLWHLGEKSPATPWEAELDKLVQQQLVTMNYAKRKKIYDRAQQIIAEQLPLICLVSPNILAAAKTNLANFQPSILPPYALGNVDQLYWRQTGNVNPR
ncbi:MAG TPA: ABC transporter substrate-binding protein [Candidatus Acidoferrales bacterium]|nr:ABC transporter substrate-binding protein [Candidatus Acidoferrales bacterium]